MIIIDYTQDMFNFACDNLKFNKSYIPVISLRLGFRRNFLSVQQDYYPKGVILT